MRNLYFYFNIEKFPQLRGRDCVVQRLCRLLVMGDMANDKEFREFKEITLDSEHNLLDSLESLSLSINKSADLYAVGFTHKAAPALANLIRRKYCKLFVVNAPNERHSAALVAVANVTKRINDFVDLAML